MRKCFNSFFEPLVPLIIIVGILSLLILFPVDSYSEESDTQVLQLQWTYPISISDMKLSDLDLDGANEILYATNSDSSRIGIMDVVDLTISYQSQTLPGSALTVAAGHRNEDSFMDIIVGGAFAGDSGDVGYFQTFDGPGFDSVHTIDSLDNAVSAIEFYRQNSGSERKVYVGTFWHHESYVSLPPLEIYNSYSEGHLLSYDAENLTPIDTVLVNYARKMESSDLYGNNQSELIIGSDYSHLHDSHGNHTQQTSVQLRVFHPESTTVIGLDSTYIYEFNTYGLWNVSFSALVIGDCSNDGIAEIISSYRSSNNTLGERYLHLDCRNPLTREIIWSETDTGSTDQITGLAICNLLNKSTRVVCVAFKSGLIKYKSGTDGTDVGISDSLPKIDHFALGNVDQDSTTEICIASDESLYVFEAPFITTDVEETSDQEYPKDFSLFQNYPNPFNATTEIRFETPKTSLVELTIYNIMGQTIRSFEEYYPPGSHIIDWDGRNTSGTAVASGVYFYRLTAGEYRDTKKMLLLK
jgi:hypothetical protein